MHVHEMIGLIAPSMVLDVGEARKLSTAYVNVSRHYKALAGVSSKTIDTFAMGGALVAVYGPRVVAARLDRARKQPAQTARPVSPRPGQSASAAASGTPGAALHAGAERAAPVSPKPNGAMPPANDKLTPGEAAVLLSGNIPDEDFGVMN